MPDTPNPLHKTTDLVDAAFRVFGLTLGTSAATYAASAPLPDRLTLVRALLPSGFAVVPMDCPDEAVGEVMTWTGCACPNMAWEALNCALHIMDGCHEADEGLKALGAGEMTLAEWREHVKARRAANAE